MTTPTILFVLGAAILALLWGPARQRMALSRAKHRSMAGHSKMGRWLSTLIPFYEYDEGQFFRCDGAPDDGNPQSLRPLPLEQVRRVE